MKRMRGDILIEGIIWLVVAGVAAGAVWKAWSGFKASIAAPYVQAQIEADQKVVTAANKARNDANDRATHAQADTAACTTALASNSATVKKWQDEAAANLKAAQTAKAANLIASAKAKETQAAYLAIVHAQPVKDQTCTQQLAKVDKLLRDAARARQGTGK